MEFFISLILGRVINTFFHEMGHAIFALKYTTGEVIVNIGSYNSIDSLKPVFEYDRLSIYFSFNGFMHGGYCQFEEVDNLTMNEYILIVAGGPLASLAMSVFYLILGQVFIGNYFIEKIIYALLITSFIDFIVNISPFKSTVGDLETGIMYNDGFQLKELIQEKAILDENYRFKNIIKNRFRKVKKKLSFLRRIKKVSKKQDPYKKALLLFQAKKYHDCILELKKVINFTYFFAEPYRLMIDCYIKVYDFENALKYYEILKTKFELNEEDNNRLDLINSKVRSI